MGKNFLSLIGTCGFSPAGKALAALTPSSSTRPLQIPHRVHAAVGIDVDAAEEPVGVIAQRPQRVVAAARHADHRPLDPVLVHQLEQTGHRVGLRLDLRDVLEHVLRGELEVFERLTVAQVGAQEVVVVPAIGLREADHQVDHADVGRHGHVAFSCAVRRFAALRLGRPVVPVVGRRYRDT